MEIHSGGYIARLCEDTAAAAVRVLVAASIVAGLVFAAAPQPVHACSCDSGPESPIPRDFDLASSRDDTIFRGTVVSVRTYRNSPTVAGGPLEVRFDVSTLWKGHRYETIYLTTDSFSAGCGYHFYPGVEYTVYASEGRVGWCGYTKRVSVAADDLALLGSGEPPLAGTISPKPDVSALLEWESQFDEADDGGIGLAPYALGLSAAVLVAAVALWLNRRRRGSVMLVMLAVALGGLVALNFLLDAVPTDRTVEAPIDGHDLETFELPPWYWESIADETYDPPGPNIWRPLGPFCSKVVKVKEVERSGGSLTDALEQFLAEGDRPESLIPLMPEGFRAEAEALVQAAEAAVTDEAKAKRQAGQFYPNERDPLVDAMKAAQSTRDSCLSSR